MNPKEHYNSVSFGENEKVIFTKDQDVKELEEEKK